MIIIICSKLFLSILSTSELFKNKQLFRLNFELLYYEYIFLSIYLFPIDPDC